jgi:outer membrane beta-barrel protein
MRIFSVGNIRKILIASVVFMGLGWSSPGWSQFEDDTKPKDVSSSAAGQAPDSGVEALYDSFDQEQTQQKKQEVKREKQKAKKEVGTLTDLATLAPFEDIAVIQRRFLPKTGRFEISPNAMVTLNNPFFSNMGLGLRGSYYFVEKHGIELQYFMLSNSSRAVTDNLENKRGVRTESLTVAKSYMGAAYKWNPIYGKMTLMNKVIVPFDLYFTLGYGLTNTNESNGEGTIHIGTGQAFALTKMMSIRWDLTWNFYSAKATDSTGANITNNQDDLFISLGMGFYFPEAKYR